jgi:hypothetical protein
MEFFFYVYVHACAVACKTSCKECHIGTWGDKEVTVLELMSAEQDS